jgi:hypothetical protein
MNTQTLIDFPTECVSLLPKLISGELRVPDAERMVGKAL